MRLIYKIKEYQPHMVSVVAVAYLGGTIIGKALCKENEAVGFNNFKCFSSNDVCHAPGEVTIPLAYVTAGTSGDSVTGGTLSFAPQVVGDAETLTFQLV
jgi:hypothetical protein